MRTVVGSQRLQDLRQVANLEALEPISRRTIAGLTKNQKRQQGQE